MTEIYKIEDEFSICDKDCNYLNKCLDTYVDYYKNINPYDTQLILAKSNIGNEIDDMEEIDYLDYFEQNFDKIDNVYTDLILKPRGMKKKLRFDDKVMEPEVIDAADLTPDFDKINYNEQSIMNEQFNDEIKMIENEPSFEGKIPIDNKEVDIQNINQGEGDIVTVVKTEDNRKINETNNNVNETNNNVNETNNNVNETVNNVNETMNNVNETVNNVNETIDNTSKPVTTNIDARTTNNYNQDQINKEMNEPIVEKSSSIPEIKEASERNIDFERETEKEPPRENELINNQGIKSDLSDFSLRRNEGILNDKNIYEEKRKEEQQNIIPLENDEKRNREKTENKELNNSFQQEEIEKPDGKFEYNPQRSSVIEQKPDRPMEQRPMEQRPMEQRPMEQRPMEQRPMEQRPMEQRPMGQKKEENEDKPNISISLEDDSGSGSGMNQMMYPHGYPSSGNSIMLEKMNEQTQEIAKLKGDLEKERSDNLGKDNMDRINKVIKEKDDLIKKRQEEITDLTQKIENIPENSSDSNVGNEIIEKNQKIEELQSELEKVKYMQNNMITRQTCDVEKDEQMNFLKGIYDHLMNIEGKCDDTTLESIQKDQTEITNLINGIQTSIKPN
jgi:hypothetical protein